MADKIFFGLRIHRVTSFFGSTRRKVAAAVVALALVGGGAVGIFAYMLSGAQGSGSYASTTPIQQSTPVNLTVTVTATSTVQNAGGTPDTQWTLGDHQMFNVHLDNPSQTPVTINALHFAWAINGTDMTNGPLGGSFKMVDPNIYPQTMPAGSGLSLGIEVDFVNLPVDQSSLAGALPTFTVSVS